MKTLIQLFLWPAVTTSFLSLAFAQSQSRVCSNSSPKICVGDSVFSEGSAAKLSGLIGGTQATVTYSNGGTSHNIYINSIGLATTGACTRVSAIKFCNGDTVYVDGSQATLVAFNAYGLFTVSYRNGGTSYNLKPEKLNMGNKNSVSKTKPRFIIGEPVYFSGSHATVVGFTSEGLFTIMYSNGGTSYNISVERLGKTQPTSVLGLTCEDVEGELGDLPEDVKNSFLALANISTSERAAYLGEISKALSGGSAEQVDPKTTLMARFAFAKIVSQSTAKAVKVGFNKAVEQDQKSLEALGWKSIDQIDPQVSTLNFAARVLSASVKLRMSMPALNESVLSFRARLASAVAEPRLSAKMANLQAISQDMQPLLMELLQDPRHSSLGMVAQEFAGWILKN
jgi:hypothetical protein